MMNVSSTRSLASVMRGFTDGSSKPSLSVQFKGEKKERILCNSFSELSEIFFYREIDQNSYFGLIPDVDIMFWNNDSTLEDDFLHGSSNKFPLEAHLLSALSC